MTLEEERLNQNEWVRWLLNQDHKAELWKILAFWERYREEWEQMRDEFWNNHEEEQYKELLKQNRGIQSQLVALIRNIRKTNN